MAIPVTFLKSLSAAGILLICLLSNAGENPEETDAAQQIKVGSGVIKPIHRAAPEQRLQISVPPENGRLSLDAANGLHYQSQAGYLGNDHFSYQILDTGGNLLEARRVRVGVMVNIPDGLFKTCILESHDQDGDGEINENEAAAVTAIACMDRRIIDTTGAEAFFNLTDLDLSDNFIAALTDLSPLASLERLNLNDNDLETLPPLFDGQVTPALPRSLVEIRVENNNLTDLPSFRNAVNLTLLACKGNYLTLFPELPIASPLRLASSLSLTAEDNCIYEPPPLTGGPISPLTELNLSNNFLTSMDRIAANSLQVLRVDGNRLSSQPDLSGLDALTEVALGGNQFTEVNADTLPGVVSILDLKDMCLQSQPNLANFGNLTNINVTNNKLADIQPALLPAGLETLTAVNAFQGEPGQLPQQPDLSPWASMRTLDLSGFGITTISPQDLPPGLENLALNGNLLTQIPDLSDQLALRVLDISGNQLLELEAQKLPPGLRVLIANDNLISQVPQLPPGIERLVLNNNLIFNQPDLRNMQGLSSLSLAGNGLSAINSNLLPSVLTQLDLSNNQLTSVNGLNHPLLTTLNLSDNQISNLPGLMQINALRDLNMANNRLGAAAVTLNFPPTLRTLNLSGNDLSGATQFGQAPGLRVLNVGTCNLDVLPDLTSLTALETLVAQSNQLSSLQNVNALGGEPLPAHMLDIVIADNNFTMMPDLARYENLSNLDVSNNQLMSLVPTQKTALPPRIRSLNASSNLLTQIPDFRENSNMRVLTLTHNQIRDLNDTLPAGLNILTAADNQLETQPDLSGFTLMRELDLSINNLTEIDPELLPPSLSVLILHGNQMTAMPDLSTVASIMVLNLADNLLAEVAVEALPHFLTDLDLSNNRISDLTDLNALTVLRELDLSNNHLTAASADQLPGDLVELKLNGNDLREIPELTGFTFLTRLEISNNRIESIENLPPFISRLEADRNLISDLGDTDRFITLRRFDLTQNPLNNLPDMRDLILMRHLHLDHTGLSDLSNLPINLVEISASNNRIDPDTVQLSLITEMLDLSFNFMTGVPDISNALLLEDLNLSFNRLTDLNGINTSPTLGVLPAHRIRVERNLLTQAACDEIAQMEAKTSLSGALFEYEPIGNYTQIADDFPSWGQDINLILDWVAVISEEGSVNCIPGVP